MPKLMSKSHRSSQTDRLSDALDRIIGRLEEMLGGHDPLVNQPPVRCRAGFGSKMSCETSLGHGGLSCQQGDAEVLL
jgi:hypothetical protein